MPTKTKRAAASGADEQARPEGEAETTEATGNAEAEAADTAAPADPAPGATDGEASGDVVTDAPVALLVGEAGTESLLPAAVVAQAETNVVTFDPPTAARRGARERARASTGAPRYAVRALAQGEAVIEIYDEIGFWGVTARQFLNDLRALGSVQSITVAINSPGGDVFDGIAIHNALRNHEAEITVRIDGIAASIASVIAMAGDKIVMPSNAMIMIHDPWTIAMGAADDMRKVADSLDKMADAIVTSYAAKSGAKPDRVREMMREETWMTAQEAVALGFADEVREPVKAAAHFDLSAFRHAPNALLPPVAKPTADRDDTERALEIMDLCAVAKLPHMARDLIASGATVDVVRARLTNAQAAASSSEIDNRVPTTTTNSPAPGNGGQPAGAILPSEIYSRRRSFGQPAINKKEG